MCESFQCPVVGMAHYSATKAGVLSLTKSTAKELARYGVRCNAIMPGSIDTPMLKNASEETVASVCADTPLSRIGKPTGEILPELNSNNYTEFILLF